MSQRNLAELEAFLSEQGVDVDDRAFELELNSFGWRVVAEKRSRHSILLWIECAVDCAVDNPRNLTVAADIGTRDRDLALMRALERVLDYGLLREEADSALGTDTFTLADRSARHENASHGSRYPQQKTT